MHPKPTYRPPKLTGRLLNWVCKDDLLEEIEGDLCEHYQRLRSEKPRFTAWFSYWYHVLNFLRPFALKKIGQNSNTTIMFRSYFKTGLRNLIRQKLSSTINVVGLATTTSIAIVVYVLVSREFMLDKFHKDSDRIFSIQTEIGWNGVEETWSKSPAALGPSIQNDAPQVSLMSRIDVKWGVVRVNENVFNERLTFAENDYLDIFSFPLERGEKRALDDKTNVILSNKSASKYFNSQDVIGREIKVILNGKSFLFTVAGVAAPFSKYASFDFDFLLPFSLLEDVYDVDQSSWRGIRNNSAHTFVKLDQASSLENLMATLKPYEAVINEQNEDWPILSIKSHELSTLARNTQFIREAYTTGSTPQVMIMFAIISALLLFSSIFNYINIAISMAQRRFNEIAIRKVMGGQRKQLVTQFITENFILCLFAILFGIVLAHYVLLPGINSLFGGAAYSLNLVEDPQLLLFIVALFLVTGFASGAYPSLFVSSYQPVKILGGKTPKSGKERLTRSFLFGQFFLTFFAVVSGFLFTEINEFQEGQDWGYDPENILVIDIESEEQFDVMRQWAETSPRVSQWAGSRHQVGRSSVQETISLGEDKLNVQSFSVGYGFLELMDFELSSGRSFENIKSDESKAIIVNRDFLSKLNLSSEEALNTKVEIKEESYNVVGVLDDFHFQDFFSPISPTVFHLTSESSFGYISLKTVESGLVDLNAMARQEWNKSFPDSPYTAFFQEDVFDNFFESTGSLNQVMKFVAFVAICLSSMGLFGLISLSVAKKLKEYCIRKVLGAPDTHILKLISRQFLILLAGAVIIGAPLSYGLYDTIFQQVFPGAFDTISASSFVLTTLILAGVIVLTVSSHVIQLLRMNPIKSLRQE